MLGLDVLVLSQDDVKKVLTPELAIHWVEKAYSVSASPQKFQMPRKLYFTYPDGDMRVMPALCEIDGKTITGAKLVSIHFENRKRNLPVVIGSFVLIDSDTGALLCVMDATLLTAMRTGASGAVAVKHLFEGKEAVLGIVGCGTQSRTQVLCISKVIRISKIYAFDINPQAHEGLVKFCRELGIDVSDENKLENVSKCDIIITLTPSTKPFLTPELSERAKLILAFGADGPGKQELFPEILNSSIVIVDNREQALHGGEINVPIRQGLFSPDKIFAELGEVVAGKKKVPSGKKVVFDSTGIALLDVAVGWAIYLQAKEKGVGKKLAFH